MGRGLKLLAVLLFYILNALLVVAFSGTLGVFTYPLIIFLAILFARSLDLKVPLRGFWAGVITAGFSMSLVIAVLLMAGAIRLGPIRDDMTYVLLAGLAIQLLVSFGEELAFRAGIFQGLDETLGLWPAAVLSAAGFAVLHLPSMNLLGIAGQSDMIALATIFVAGIVLALLYKYGGLFNAITFHFTWNFIEYNLFMMGPLEGAVYVTKTGPEILTGGAFGPEASIISLVVILLLAFFVWVYYTKLNRPAAQNISA